MLLCGPRRSLGCFTPESPQEGAKSKPPWPRVRPPPALRARSTIHSPPFKLWRVRVGEGPGGGELQPRRGQGASGMVGPYSSFGTTFSYCIGRNTTAQSRQGLPRARSKDWAPSGHAAPASRSVPPQWRRAYGGGQQGGGEAPESEAGGKDGPQRWTLWAQLWAFRSVLKEAPRPQSAARPPGL